ncbi:hypothetical protein LXL04_010787 [Taraxacum kok-saghyz]
MDLVRIASTITICLVLSSWGWKVVDGGGGKTPLCIVIEAAFKPCLDFFDKAPNMKGGVPTKECCKGVAMTKDTQMKTKQARVAVCKCIQTFLRGHNYFPWANLGSKCDHPLGIPTVHPDEDCGMCGFIIDIFDIMMCYCSFIVENEGFCLGFKLGESVVLVAKDSNQLQEIEDT